MTCDACGHANREGARFCESCGSPMGAPACAGCGTELRAGAKFCDHCGMPVAGTPTPPSTLQAPAPGRGDERKRITVLFADLAGSTAMQEALDPEMVRRLMGRWSSAMRTAIERHGGLIDHFAGDGIVATWGVQMVREDDAVRALTAAWAMRTALTGINEELEPRLGMRLRMRTGLHTGDVVISAEGFIVGDTMNTAARIEQNAPEGEVLISELTYQLVRDHAAFRALEPIAAKGKSAPVRVWQLLSLQAPAAGPSMPFVGRGPELGVLHATLEAAIAERACRAATVVGSPGLGKSRLVAEFVGGLEGRARVVRASCPAYGDGMTYAPVAELVRGLAFIDDADDVSERVLAAMGLATTAGRASRPAWPASSAPGRRRRRRRRSGRCVRCWSAAPPTRRWSSCSTTCTGPSRSSSISSRTWRRAWTARSCCCSSGARSCTTAARR